MNATVRSTSALLVALAVAGCGGGGKVPAAPSPPPAATTATPPPAETPPAPVDAGPTAEDTLAWVLAVVASGQVTTADIASRFAPGFLKQVPAEQVVTIFGALHAQLPPVKILKQEGLAPRTLSALLDTGSGGVRIDIAMTASTPRTIEGLLFKPASAEAPPKSYGDAVAMLEKAGGKSQLFVGELVNSAKACTPRQNHNTTQSLALGSTAKLWVLLALDEKIRGDKQLSWDTKLAIRDAAKSLPSGTMQDEAAGTEHTLREFATQMISISDNTATDHLIDFVGDAAVEKALKLAKHGKPAANTPFLRTRELFGLKVAATADELAGYRKANLAGKRKLLAELRARPIDMAQVVKDWGAPRALDLEWFGDGRDLCNVMAALATRSKLRPSAELLTALSKNAGVEVDRGQWNYVGFKGGSEPGVMNLTFLLQRADGVWFVVVIAVNDDTHALDEGLVVNAATGVLAILGAEGAAAAAVTR